MIGRHTFFLFFVYVTIIISEKQLNQNKQDQVTAKPNETKIVQMSKSGTPKSTTSQKPAITNTAKPLQPVRQPIGTNEQERHKKPKLDDYDKDLKHRRIEKASAEGKLRYIFIQFFSVL